jgi:hypothetical protein
MPERSLELVPNLIRRRKSNAPRSKGAVAHRTREHFIKRFSGFELRETKRGRLRVAFSFYGRATGPRSLPGLTPNHCGAEI